MHVQNLALAVGSIAVLALPMMLGAIPLWVAVACHEGTTLLVVLNSLRLLRAPAGEAELQVLLQSSLLCMLIHVHDPVIAQICTSCQHDSQTLRIP